MDRSGIHVAEYLTALPSREMLVPGEFWDLGSRQAVDLVPYLPRNDANS
jgi:hypothetical protein